MSILLRNRTALRKRSARIERQHGMLRYPQRFKAEPFHLTGKRPRPHGRLIEQEENSDLHRANLKTEAPLMSLQAASTTSGVVAKTPTISRLEPACAA